jgi:hypothetical protein
MRAAAACAVRGAAEEEGEEGEGEEKDVCGVEG